MPLDLFADGPEAWFAAAGSCRPVMEAFVLIRDGASTGRVAAATADAIARCHCELGDLDAYVARFGATFVPWPTLGAVDVRPAILATMSPDATVDDLARALIAGR